HRAAHGCRVAAWLRLLEERPDEAPADAGCHQALMEKAAQKASQSGDREMIAPYPRAEKPGHREIEPMPDCPMGPLYRDVEGVARLHLDVEGMKAAGARKACGVHRREVDRAAAVIAVEAAQVQVRRIARVEQRERLVAH